MKKIFASFTSLLFLISPAFAFAQTTPVPSPVSPSADLNSTVWVNPSFNVGNILVQQDAGTGLMHGTVDVVNDNTASFGGIRMQALLMDPAPVVTTPNTIVQDTAQIIDRVILPSTYSFAPNEKKTISFVYNPPKLPLGQYRLRLQIITQNGNQYGWEDYATTVGIKDAQFISVAQGPLLLGKNAHDPLEGVNIPASSALTAELSVKASGAKTILATPVLTTYSFDVTGPVVSVTKGAPIIISSNKNLQTIIPIATPSAPGAYQATLVFHDASGNVISPMAQYRWVVIGITARIVSGRFTSLEDSKATVQFDIAGPADGQNSVNTEVHVVLLDGDKVITEGVKVFSALGKNGLQSGTAAFTFDSPLVNPGIRITLANTANNSQLDAYEIHVPPAPIQQIMPSLVPTPNLQSAKSSMSAQVFFIIIGIIALAIIIVLAWVVVSRRNASKLRIPPLVLLLVGIGFVGMALIAKPIHATNGVVIDAITQPGDKYTIYSTINKPIHNNDAATSPVDPTKIPVSFTLYYGTCNNKVTSPVVAIYNLHNGGDVPIGGNLVGKNTVVNGQTHTTLYLKMASPSNLSWDTYQDISTNKTNGSFDQLVYNAYPFTRCTGSQNCTLSVNFTGNLSVPATPDSTTLLWIFRVGYDAIAENEHFQLMQTLYTWVNFRIPATPTPTPSASPTPRPTPSVSPSASPSVSPSASPTTSPSTSPTQTPVSSNRAPVSIANISAGSGAFGSSITVEQGTSVSIRLSANGSSDPDGWATPLFGVTQGGKCEWNSDLNQGVPTFETTIADPSSPAACQISLGALTFNDAPGTYTYNLLRITDASGAQSNNGAVTVLVVAKGSPTPTLNPTASASPSASPTFNPGSFQETR